MSTVEITIEAGDNGKVSPEGKIKIARGSDLKIVATPDPHYEVLNWNCFGPQGIDASTFYLNGVSRDTSVSVSFIRKAHAIHCTPQKGAEIPEGRMDPQSSTTAALVVEEPEGLTFRALPAPGHFIRKWLVDREQAQIGGRTYTLANIMCEHWVEAIFSPRPNTGPFAPMPTVEPVTLVDEPRLAEEIRRVRKTTGAGHCGVADLTVLVGWPEDQPPQIPYAESVRSEKSLVADSIAKVGVMLALFRLRKQLRLLAEEVDALVATDLFHVASHYWKKSVNKAYPRYAADFPRLEALFEGVPREIRFTQSTKTNLRWMIEDSSNTAAKELMQLLGFQYINGAVRNEGLSDGPGRGIWLQTRFGDLVRWKGAPKAAVGQGVSPRALTKMFLAIYRQRLVDSDASHEMDALLAAAQKKNGLCHYRNAVEQIGKVGYNDNNRLGIHTHGHVGLYRLPMSILPENPPAYGEFCCVTVGLQFTSDTQVEDAFRQLHQEVARKQRALP